MREQAWRIRRRLRGLGGVVPIAWLAQDLGIPAASIRRSLTELSVVYFCCTLKDGMLAVQRDIWSFREWHETFGWSARQKV